jgi:hypothetical protein
VNSKYVTILKPQDLQAINPHKGRKAMHISSTKVEYTTDITLGRIVRFKKLSKRNAKRCKTSCYVGASNLTSTACRLVAFNATFRYCLLRILRLSVPLTLSWNVIWYFIAEVQMVLP